MSAQVIAFPRVVGADKIDAATVHVEPSLGAREWDVVYSPKSGNLSVLEATYSRWNEADAHAERLAAQHGADYARWLPTGGAA